MSVHRSLSIWLGLLMLLPVCLLAGWLFSKAPAPTPRGLAAVMQVADTADTEIAVEPSVGTEPPSVTPVEPGAATTPTDAHHGRESWNATPAEPAPTPPAEEAESRGTYSEWMSLESAVMESRRTGKPILIDFSADWCGPCQRLKHEVFEDSDRARIVQTTVVPVSIVDRRRENGENPPEIEALQQKFGVDAFPTLIVFWPETGKGAKAQGYGDADQAVEWIQQAARAVR
jgi:thiol-disulfide isomerase/thioredoxin